MLKSKDVPAEEQSELFRLADEMQRRDLEADREHRSASDAAAELGVSPEYLEKAAAELHARRLEAIERNRRRNRWIAIGVVVLALGSLWAMMRPAPRRMAPTSGVVASSPLVLDLSGASLRQSSPDPSAAKVAYEGGRLTVDIQSMVPGSSDKHFANVVIPISRPGDYRRARVTFSGSGLAAMRIDLEDGNVRWKNANIPVESGTRTETIDLTRSTKQNRRGDKWRNVAWSPTGPARELVLKFGDTVNSEDSRGAVQIEKIVLE